MGAARLAARKLAAAAIVLLVASIAMAEPAFAASSLVLDNDATGPLVTAGPIGPGPQSPRCVLISYQDASDGDRIGLFSAVTGSLAAYLNVQIDVGTGGVYGDCSGFSGTTIFTGTLAAFGAAHGSSSNAVTAATLAAGNGGVSFRFRFTLADTNAAQDSSASAWFTWVAEPPVVAPPSPSPSPSPTSSPTTSPSPTSSPTSSQTFAPPPAPSQTFQSQPPASPTASAPQSPPVSSAPSGVGSAQPSSSPSPSTSPSPSPTRKKGSETVVPVIGGSQPPPSTSFLGNAEHLLGKSVQTVVEAAAPAARGSAFSLIFLAILIFFLLVQSRIDRRDPKLSNAPLLSNFLPFEPPGPGGSHDLA